MKLGFNNKKKKSVAELVEQSLKQGEFKYPDENDSSAGQQGQEQQVQEAKGEGFFNGIEDATIDEADSIVEMVEENNSSREEEAEKLVAEAEDIISGFGSKSSSSSSASAILDSADEEESSVDEPPPPASTESSSVPSASEPSSPPPSSAPKEYDLGLGNSPGSDKKAEVFQAMSSDDEDDIGLDELFETAAALDVVLETEDSDRNIRSAEEILEGESSTPYDAESTNSSLSCSTIEEEHTESIEEEQTTIPDSLDEDETSEESEAEEIENTERLEAEARPKGKQRSTSAAHQKTFAGVEIEQPVVYSKSRTLLYDSDEETKASSNVSNQRDTTVASSYPMPWFSAVPYSTGKHKHTEDGISVVSDDIWYKAPEPIIAPGHALPYTMANPKYDPTLSRDNARIRRRNILIAIATLVVVILLAVGIYFGVTSATEKVSIEGAEATIPPTIPATATASGTPEPVSGTSEPVSETIESEPITETIESVTDSPTKSPTDSPTNGPTAATTDLPEPVTDFEIFRSLSGDQQGDNLGSVVSLSPDGKLLATLSNSPNEPVQVFTRNDHNSHDWLPLPKLPIDGSIATSESAEKFGSTIATAKTEGQMPVVAISSQTQVEVYQLFGNEWVPRGDALPWDTPQGVSYTSMDLSADATILAIGYVDARGTTISVTTYHYDMMTQSWTPVNIDPVAYRDATTRSISPEEGTILSMSLTLSGDGSVLTVDEWDVGSPQVIVQSFEWDDKKEVWTPRGEIIEFPFGPVSTALSEDGQRLAIIAEHPGKGSVFEWSGKAWESIGGNTEHGFLPGGSSVAIVADGNRILIGDKSTNKVEIFDYDDEAQFFYTSEHWSSWMPSASLYGADDSGFGTSVTMDRTGTMLGVGAPNNSDGTGEVTIYA